jgi:hypothetical protein
MVSQPDSIPFVVVCRFVPLLPEALSKPTNAITTGKIFNNGNEIPSVFPKTLSISSLYKSVANFSGRI